MIKDDLLAAERRKFEGQGEVELIEKEGRVGIGLRFGSSGHGVSMPLERLESLGVEKAVDVIAAQLEMRKRINSLPDPAAEMQLLRQRLGDQGAELPATA